MTKISKHTCLFYWNIAALCWCKIILCSRVSFAFWIISNNNNKRSVRFNTITSSRTSRIITRDRRLFIVGTRKDANLFGVSSFCHRRRPLFVPIIQASSSSENDDNIDHSNEEEETDATWLNLELIGVSVSPIGFLLLYQTNWHQTNNTTQTVTLPIRISTDDTREAKSIEALTILQLINGIDMAGTTFPPNILTSLAALNVLLLNETNQTSIFHEEAVQQIHQAMRNALDGISYEEATPWQRNKIQYPKISLPRVRISIPEMSLYNTTTTSSTTTTIPLPIQFHLECTIQSTTPLSIPLFSEDSFQSQHNTVKSVPLEDLDIYGIINPLTSAAFLSLALSLRYKASVGMYSTDLQRWIVWTETHNLSTSSAIFVTAIPNTDQHEHSTNSQIAHSLPHWKSIQSIRNINERVTESFGQNFEVGRLEAALQIAIDRGDEQAADKIRKSIVLKQQQQQQSNMDLFESDTPTTRELSLSTSMEGEENPTMESYLLYNTSTTADKDEDSFQ